ncbi:Hypothetical protein MNA02_1825 [Streptococcus thermophilus]|nr:Hypothetical protein MNA02_1825 [Streptococcus thermophilus]AOZ59089.1 hypothetical protein BBD27_1005 [Streptococcus thermophilus]KPL36412.1 hypothetical protein ADU38_1899 [Streptococcus thermophilus]
MWVLFVFISSKTLLFLLYMKHKTIIFIFSRKFCIIRIPKMK